MWADKRPRQEETIPQSDATKLRRENIYVNPDLTPS